MSNQGDDCYFFFYSTCTKGDSCPFRHCKAALGNETVCTLWQEGRCFRQICKFRHMEIDKKRSVIPCFWENQHSGCQKGNCAFRHNKGRYVDGIYIPPSKTEIAEPEPSDTVLQISQTPSKLTVASTTHLHGVKKMEAAENVPSPTHPPVVINAADDDEDEDDEGDEPKTSGQQGGHLGARRVTTWKMDVLSKGPDVGVKTFEELNSSCKKVQEELKDGTISTLNVLESSYNSENTEKNVAVIRTVMFSKNDPPSISRSLAQRLGKRKAQESFLDGESFPAANKPLSERLGKKIMFPVVGSDAHLKKIHVPRLLKDRLGLPPEQNSAETETAANPTIDFHIKTLQEIRQEKASQRPEQEPKCISVKSEDLFCSKSHLFIKPQPTIHIKSLHEIQAEKKQRQLKDAAQKDENKVDKSDCKVGKDFQASQNFRDQHCIESGEKQRGQKGIKLSHLTYTVTSKVDLRRPLSVSLKETKAIFQPVEHVQIKTLEEIRKEKALRIQHTWQATNTKDLQSVSKPQVESSQKRILRLSKTQVSKETDQGTSDANSQTNNSATALDTKTTEAFGPPVKVSEKVGSDKTIETQSFKGASVADEQDSSKILPGDQSKGKQKVKVEPMAIKKQSPTKAVIKQRAQQSSPVAEVKPLINTTTSTDKKKTTILLPAADSSISQNVKGTSAKLHKESSQITASDPVYSSTVQTVAKPRRASASSGKPSVFNEDDFDELIWDISDGKLEDEIDLDPSKDEDDLLMELSEMIDS